MFQYSICTSPFDRFKTIYIYSQNDQKTGQALRSVNGQLAKQNERGALETAKNTANLWSRDLALFSIVVKAKNPAIRESAADSMLFYGNRDRAYTRLCSAKLASNDVVGAFSTAVKIRAFRSRDDALIKIFNQSGDLNLKERVTDRLSFIFDREKGYKLIAKEKLAKGDLKGAVKTATKLSSRIDQDLIRLKAGNCKIKSHTYEKASNNQNLNVITGTILVGLSILLIGCITCIPTRQECSDLTHSLSSYVANEVSNGISSASNYLSNNFLRKFV